jgi:hypothetical protein
LGAQKKACAVAALCIYALAAFVYFPVISDHPFAYDEADYMWAGNQGVWANYSSAHAISFIDFLRKGLELSHNSGQRQSFSEYIRSTGDIEFYRHYHGPMYAYWLALLHDAGARHENVLRGGSFLIHMGTAALILFGMWAIFPSLPPVAGLMSSVLFVFNRSALTAATAITQHVLFTFFCVAALLAFSMFMRSLETKWFYATLALIACSICTVETSVLLLGALGLSMMVEHRRIREQWPTFRAFAILLIRGAGVFALTMLIVWPLGVLKLGAAKGFLLLAYFALARKTYSPLSPIGLWGEKIMASPWEFALLIPGFIAAFALWRRFAQRRELLPWLAFIVCFFIAMLKMTLDNTYYYAPLTAAFTVATGVAAGILWQRWPVPGRIALAAVVTASAAGVTFQFRDILRDLKATRPYEAAVLEKIAERPVEADHELYVPFQLVPMLHYYHPGIKTAGYDFDYPLARLADEVMSPDAAGFMFCEASVCEKLERQTPGIATHKTLLDRPGPNGQPLYLIDIRKSGGL